MTIKKRNLADIGFRRAPNRKIAELLSGSTGAQHVTFRIVDLAPASEQEPRHPHRHATFEETMYVLQGEGRLWVEGRVYKMREADALLVPSGLYHMVLNATEEPLRLACFFPVAEGVGVDQQEQTDITLIPTQVLAVKCTEV